MAPGLRRVVPVNDDTETEIDIIAIHGLETESPGTWAFKSKGDNRIVNWLIDDNMLPAAIPKARIFTYDWNGNFFKDGLVQTIRGHADTMLGQVMSRQTSPSRPIIFIASCFGGLILAKAFSRAALEGSPHRSVFLDTVGIMFLATPFRGSEGAGEAQWLAVVGGILGNIKSPEVVRSLTHKDGELHEITQTFAELIHRDSWKIPIHCFFETKETELLRRFLQPNMADITSTFSTALGKRTKKILVTEQSACLDGCRRMGLAATHSGTNKFSGPDDPNYVSVANAVRELAEDATHVITRRRGNKSVVHDDSFHGALSYIPLRRNGGFVGREEILTQLSKTIPPHAFKDGCRHTFLEGLGGIGKTQIALEAAYRVHESLPDCSIFWVPAIDLASFENAYREVGRILNMPGIDDEKADVKTLVKRRLSDESTGSWLLIIDNADDTDLLFKQEKLASHLPSSRKGSILFTTRNHAVAANLGDISSHTIAVDEMNDAEASKMLRSQLQVNQMDDDESMKKLLEHLANLPLAIKQASAFMACNLITVSEYLNLCMSSDAGMTELLSEEFEDLHRYTGHARQRNPIASTWLVSFEHISKHNPEAAYYLKFMSFLADKNIPQSLLPTASSDVSKIRAIGTLKSYAFITERNTDGEQNKTKLYDMHRLVRLAVRIWLKQSTEYSQWSVRVIGQLAEMYPDASFKNRDSWIPYLPHVHEASRLETAVYKQFGRLLFRIALSYFALGNYSTAEPLFRQAVDVVKKVWGPEHPVTLGARTCLAESLTMKGSYTQAEAMFRQVLDKQREVLGIKHADTLESMGYLVLNLTLQEKYTDAELIARQMVDLRRDAFGPKHPLTIRDKLQLAEAYSHLDKYEAAEKEIRESLEACEDMPDQHGNTLLGKMWLAIVLGNRGNYDEAEKLCRKNLEGSEVAFGKKGLQTIKCRNNLAILLEQRGSYDEAEKLYRETLEAFEVAFGKKGLQTVKCRNNLAILLEQRGGYDEAEKLYRENIEAFEVAYGKEGGRTVEYRGKFADFLERRRRHEEATKVMESATDESS